MANLNENIIKKLLTATKDDSAMWDFIASALIFESEGKIAFESTYESLLKQAIAKEDKK